MRHLIFCGNRVLFFCLEVRKSNVFEAVKESVTTRQAAEIYGVPVGRNGKAISGSTSYLRVRLAFHPYPRFIPKFFNTHNRL